MTDASTYYVICTTSPWGHQRTTAIRGLKFETKEAAEAHIPMLAAYQRQTAFVDVRKDKSKDEAYQMHCQCCGRAIFAETGSIAHHGYQRPGDGWQTASCWGAKHLPFEVSRNVLGDLIKHLEKRLEGSIDYRGKVADGSEPVRHKYPVYDSRLGRSEPHLVTFFRETFDAAVAENKGGWVNRIYGSNKTFDRFLAADLNDRDSSIRNQRIVIKELQARYDGWKQTHKRMDKVWVRI
jgi:hypothetical protein